VSKERSDNGDKRGASRYSSKAAEIHQNLFLEAVWQGPKVVYARNLAKVPNSAGTEDSGSTPSQRVAFQASWYPRTME
jgi:hypothetical protein